MTSAHGSGKPGQAAKLGIDTTRLPAAAPRRHPHNMDQTTACIGRMQHAVDCASGEIDRVAAHEILPRAVAHPSSQHSVLARPHGSQMFEAQVVIVPLRNEEAKLPALSGETMPSQDDHAHECSDLANECSRISPCPLDRFVARGFQLIQSPVASADIATVRRVANPRRGSDAMPSYGGRPAVSRCRHGATSRSFLHGYAKPDMSTRASPS